MADESLQRCGGKVVLIRDGRRPADAEDQAATLVPVMEDGPTWQLTDQEKDDLDLYSPPVGLFGLLNRTSTAIGARRLRTMVENPCLAVDVIKDRQASVRWLHSHGIVPYIEPDVSGCLLPAIPKNIYCPRML